MAQNVRWKIGTVIMWIGFGAFALGCALAFPPLFLAYIGAGMLWMLVRRSRSARARS